MAKEDALIKDIIILGGGTAGLTTALILKSNHPDLSITVLESSDIGIVGVGEGSTEHWTHFMKYVGISIEELVRETGATFKTGIKFDNWNGDGKHYWHNAFNPYNLTLPNNISGYYTYLIANNYDPVHFVPRVVEDNEFVDNSQIGQYHFDTFKLNDFLHKKCKEKNIKFIDALIDNVNKSETGYIENLTDSEGQTYYADFFIDCSGIKRVIMKHLGVTWQPFTDYLPVNRAIAFQTEREEVIDSFTTSTALSSGWKWKIPVQDRVGNGYVFNDAFITVDQAIDEVELKMGRSISVGKDIKFVPGKLDCFMKKNCIAIGLSAFFVEPLEASSIGASIQQAFYFGGLLGNYVKGNTSVENIYNRQINEMFDNIVDFVQLHYITKRNDSEFWKGMNLKLTDFNQDTFKLFKHRMPSPQFFEEPLKMFKHDNWTKVMYGLGHINVNSVKQQWVTVPENIREMISNKFARLVEVEKNTKRISHREFINKILSNEISDI